MRRVSITGLLQAAAILTLAFSALTALPIDHAALQLFVHFKLQYLGASILLGVLLVVKRQPAYAAMMLFSTVLNGSLVFPWYLGEPEPAGVRHLKIMQANILSTNSEHDRLFSALELEQPDIIVLQEVSPEWLIALFELRTDYPYSYAEAREGNFGIAMFSRIPFASVTHIDSPPFGYPTIIAKVRVEEDVLSVVASHPTIPVSSDLYAGRNQQLESLRSVFDDLDGKTVLIGDLNTSMWDLNYRRLEHETGLRNARKGFGAVPTWPTFMPFAMIPIDHVLVSNDVGVLDVAAGPRIGSDHLPLVVSLSL